MGRTGLAPHERATQSRSPRAASCSEADTLREEGIMRHTQAHQRASTPAPPLKLPAEVWASLEPRRKQVYVVGQAIVDELTENITLPLQELVERVQAPPAHFLGALQLLYSMDLVTMDVG